MLEEHMIDFLDEIDGCRDDPHGLAHPDAARDADNALECWDDEKWADSVMWINNAIAQLESARAKITAHASLPNIKVTHG